MKNINTILNVVLGIAVAILFYFQFSGSKSSVATGSKAVAAGDFRIAYFEIDSVESQFNYYKEVSNSIQAKAQQNNNELNQLKEVFASKYQELQKNGQRMSEAEVNARQQELQQMDKTFKSKEQMMNNEMQDESLKKLQDVKKKITDYLAEYNKVKGYAFILGNNSDMLSMYYKDTAYDITSDLVKGLNELYKAKK
ncbi:MAG: OmpH family outer membrane protein [Sediminibacterium sp.]